MDTHDPKQLKLIIEAALFAAERPLAVEHLLALFSENTQPPRAMLKKVLIELKENYQQERGIELVEVASGYRFQVKQEIAPWLKSLWSKRSPRHSRALLETVAIIAYRQPITRSEIEEIRGISVNSSIIKTLLEYRWVRILAHRDSPGRPGLYGTTRLFLDYFNLKSLDELPSLPELQAMADLQAPVTETDRLDENP